MEYVWLLGFPQNGDGNRIGAGTEIRGALILPYTADVPRTSPNIGDNCSIGAKNSTMTNADFPRARSLGNRRVLVMF